MHHSAKEVKFKYIKTAIWNILLKANLSLCRAVQCDIHLNAIILKSQAHYYHPSDTKPRVTLMQNPEHNVMYTEDSVSFSCHINVSSGWEYLWYKDGNQLTESGNNLNISLAETTNTGLYKCQVKRGVDTFIQSDQSQALRLNIQGKFFLTSSFPFFRMYAGVECVYHSFYCVCCRAPKGSYNPINWLVWGLRHRQLGAQMWGAGKQW